MSINCFGVLTSGGDAPGMNAAIRAVVRTGKYMDFKIMGIRKGYNGLIYGDVFEMNTRDVSDTISRGGTILQTARCAELREEVGITKAIATANYFGIQGLIIIGGDGSFRGARDLATAGMPVIGIPATIDNDIGYTEYTIGFDTAINTAMEAVDKIRDTATSHERCNIIEVMGRSSGSIALEVGIATGAESILIPERPYDFDEDIIKPINMGKRRNKKHYIIILAEGVGHSQELAERIEKSTEIETRVTTLGYVQRGGSPTVHDRFMASRMGSMAVQLLKERSFNRIIGFRNGSLISEDIYEALSINTDAPQDIVDLSKILSI